MSEQFVQLLPHINVSLNSLASILLILGFVLIKKKQETAHRNVMLAAFAVSTLFLICYLIYHFNVVSKKFPSTAPDVARYFYYVLLASHVILAMFVPFLVIRAIVLGLQNKREAHRKVVRFAWPIWLYVSVTGVLVYVMLYQLYA